MNFLLRLLAGPSIRQILEFLLPILKSQAGDIINEYLPTALDIVNDLEHGGLPPAERRKAAFNKLQAILLAHGKTVGGYVINLIIEMAVSRLKTTTV
jgi:hypothetical protein